MTNTIYADLDGNGFPIAFFQSAAYDNPEDRIPASATAITQEQFNELHANFGRRKFLNGEVVVHTPPAPSPEEVRAHMPPLTHRQLWLAGLEIGIRESDAIAVINTIPDPIEKEAAMIEFTRSATVSRMHPLVIILLAGVGLSEQEADSLWLWAASS